MILSKWVLTLSTQYFYGEDNREMYWEDQFEQSNDIKRFVFLMQQSSSVFNC